MAVPVILATLLLSALFSASEIAFVTADRLRVELRARQSGLIGRLVERALRYPGAVLTTTLVGNNVALVVYSTLMALVLHDLLDPLALLPEWVVLILETLLAAVVVLLVGEILPKTIVREFASTAVFVLVIPLALTLVLLSPLIALVGLISQGLLKLAGTGGEPFRVVPRREFERVVEAGTLEIDQEEKEMLSNVLELGAKRLKECLTPRTDIVALEENASIEDFRALCIQSGYSKIPVFRDNIDTIVGIAIAHDLFAQPSSLAAITRPARFVPEAMLSSVLLRELKDTQCSIVIVVDEYGGTAGLITQEDLLEELFGDIQDEHDSEESGIRRVDETTFILSGRAEIDELNEQFSLNIPTGDYETIAGFILDRIQTIPKRDEQIVFEHLKCLITKVTSNRIESVRLEVTALKAEP